MNSYTISIRSDSGTETTVRVDNPDGTPRVTEVTIRAAEGLGLTAEQLPFLNVDLLLSALGPESSPLAKATPTNAALANAVGLNGSAALGHSPAATAPLPEKPAKWVARDRKPAAKRAAAKAAPNEHSAPATVGLTRTYRRMPPDLAEIYAEAGTIAAVATHYNVPRHTAQGWIGRLRDSLANGGTEG